MWQFYIIILFLWFKEAYSKSPGKVVTSALCRWLGIYDTCNIFFRPNIEQTHDLEEAWGARNINALSDQKEAMGSTMWK